MDIELAPIDHAIAEIRAGRPLIVVDDSDRENEGDLVMAASAATAEWVGFFVRHTSGVLCVPMDETDARRLNLDPMVSRNDAPLGTAFTVSVDLAEGLTTGISAAERSNTITALANSNAIATDFVRPGHVFPLIAQDGGVLTRSGHTEATVDLARLAGLPAVGLLGECVNDDGSMMRGAALDAFARANSFSVISISDLIAYRRRTENLVCHERCLNVTTTFGTAETHTFRSVYEHTEHLALCFGPVRPDRPVLVRFHRERIIDDLFGSQEMITESLFHAGLARIAEARGVFVYLRTGSTGVPAAGSSESARQQAWLDVGLGAQILNHLGVSRITALVGRQTEYVGLEGYGIDVESFELLGRPPAGSST